MLRIIHVEEIERMLLLLPDLVRQQSERSGFFPENAAAWLAQVETVLVAHNMYQAAAIAMLRSELVAARHGQVPSGVSFKGLASRSTVKRGVAAQAVQRAVDIVSSIVQENRKRFAEAEAIVQQLVAAALSRGFVVPPQPGASRTEYLLGLRSRLIMGDF
jgi:hypothetical protein